jgi:hypothetical protein
MKNLPCLVCGKLIDFRHELCKPCFKLSNCGENNPQWKGGLPKCVDCGKQLTSYGAKRCYSCNTKNSWKQNLFDTKKFGRKITGKSHCIDCGVELNDYKPHRCRKCFGKLRSVFQLGENNPNYIHGQGRGKYSLQFSPKLKQQIRERDKFICQHCGLEEEDNQRKNKQINLTVHHIDYNKDNCKNSNLISVCIGCNSKVNFNRDYWYAYFTYIMENK